MKILDEKPFGVEYQCRGCGSRLLAEAQDVKVGYFGANYGGDSPERQYYVECMVCGTQYCLDYGQVPPKVRAVADQTDPRDR